MKPNKVLLFFLIFGIGLIQPEFAFANEAFSSMKAEEIGAIAYFFIGLIVVGIAFGLEDWSSEKNKDTDGASMIIGLIFLTFIWPFVIGLMVASYFKKKEKNKNESPGSDTDKLDSV